MVPRFSCIQPVGKEPFRGAHRQHHLTRISLGDCDATGHQHICSLIKTRVWDVAMEPLSNQPGAAGALTLLWIKHRGNRAYQPTPLGGDLQLPLALLNRELHQPISLKLLQQRPLL